MLTPSKRQNLPGQIPVIVSTDDERIGDVSARYGAQDRSSSELATDGPIIDTIQHALLILGDKGQLPDMVCSCNPLRPCDGLKQ